MYGAHLINLLFSGKRLSLENKHCPPIYAPISGSSNSKTSCKNCPTPRAPDKCGQPPALSGKRPQTANSASGGFVRQIPPLPVTPSVGQPIYQPNFGRPIWTSSWSGKIKIIQTKTVLVNHMSNAAAVEFCALWCSQQPKTSPGQMCNTLLTSTNSNKNRLLALVIGALVFPITIPVLLVITACW